MEATLKVNHIIIYEVLSHDLDAYIQIQYPNAKPFSCTQDLDHSCLDEDRVHVKRDWNLDAEDQDRIALFASGETVENIIDLLLIDLCKKGKISEGTYQIKRW